MATHHDVAMMRRSRLVERPCSLGAPIREHWLMVLVGKADATYVASVPRLVVKAPEHQTVLDGAQLGEPILVHGGEGVTFGALRGRAVGSGRAHVAQAFARLCAKVVEPAVGAGPLPVVLPESAKSTVTCSRTFPSLTEATLSYQSAATVGAYARKNNPYGIAMGEINLSGLQFEWKK